MIHRQTAMCICLLALTSSSSHFTEQFILSSPWLSKKESNPTFQSPLLVISIISIIPLFVTCLKTHKRPATSSGTDGIFWPVSNHWSHQGCKSQILTDRNVITKSDRPFVGQTTLTSTQHRQFAALVVKGYQSGKRKDKQKHIGFSIMQIFYLVSVMANYDSNG